MNLTSFASIVKSLNAVSHLGAMGISLTKFKGTGKDRTASRVVLNTKSAWTEEGDIDLGVNRIFTLSVQADNTQACAVAKDIATHIASKFEGLAVVEKPYQGRIQYSVATPQTASELAKDLA